LKSLKKKALSIFTLCANTRLFLTPPTIAQTIHLWIK